MWDRNIRYISRLRSAVEMRQRPTAALLELSDPFTGWTPHDYRLQEALSIIEKEKCQTCGNPVWLCHSADNSIDFEIEVGACYAKAELEDYEEKPGVEKLEPGQYRYAKAVGIKNEDGSYDPLPRRFEALSKV